MENISVLLLPHISPACDQAIRSLHNTLTLIPLILNRKETAVGIVISVVYMET